ncbi:MAG TPA: acetyl-CoA carboxylase carboxyltransferase subunit alpha [Armatimonadota bacterium]|nr:acetyl-CoA carboxylase carboxyltransferase subunit alpha [Armatimonadota bacterium]
MSSSPLNILDFEKPILELEAQIAEIKRLTAEEGTDRSAEITALEEHRDRLMAQIFSNLSPWDRTLLARHPKRPYTLDYVRLMFDDYMELHGDRLFSDDKAMIGGIGVMGNHQMLWVGQQKGRDLKDRQFRNFGSAKPEGYRKAMRLMKLAEKFHRPILCLVDTPAADCSVGAEERGISEAIARNLMEMSTLEVPVIVAILGEGGSGGALGIGVGNRVLMLENAIYSVIPPEGCAAILFRDPNRKIEAAEALKITSQHALELGVIDEVVPEPLGGAHRNVEQTAKALRETIIRHLNELSTLTGPELAAQRYDKFRNMGTFLCEELTAVTE